MKTSVMKSKSEGGTNKLTVSGSSSSSSKAKKKTGDGKSKAAPVSMSVAKTDIVSVKKDSIQIVRDNVEYSPKPPLKTLPDNSKSTVVNSLINRLSSLSSVLQDDRLKSITPDKIAMDKKPSSVPEKQARTSGSNAVDVKRSQDYSSFSLNAHIVNTKQELLEKEFLSVSQYVNKRRFLQLKIKAEEAIRNEMTFAICGRSNGYSTVRKFFITRNWVERYANPDDRKPIYNNLAQAPDHEMLVLSLMISRAPVKFIWAEGFVNWGLIGKSTIVNKFPPSARPISTKVGLLSHLNGQAWTYNANYSYVKHPRSIAIFDEDDLRHFSSQFRVNACVCLVKHFVEYSEVNEQLVTESGTVPLETIDFAIQRVCEFITYMENSDLDRWNITVVSEDDWALFLLRFQDVTHFSAKYKNMCNYNVDKLLECCKTCVKHVKEFWPDLDFEGVRNLWIVKPSASSCGRGIKIFRTLVDIVNHCKPGSSFLAQKYIERPMLVYKTKFDIRQWFIITSVHPLVVYLYDINYLRFCSREFSLVNLHEAVHLSNNSVQCRYTNPAGRHPELPNDNMWDNEKFLQHLRIRKEDDKWFAITLPGIRKGIVGALLASQEYLNHRANCFNLYGADFMITEDFVPWLIEINNGPCLRPTTSVTARLCPMVIEDTLNLVLKTKHSLLQSQYQSQPGFAHSDTGRFRLVYSQKPYTQIEVIRPELSVIARKARVHIERASLPSKRQMAVAMFKENVEDSSSSATYEARSLKYDQIANYKQHSEIRCDQVAPERRENFLPLQPGGVVSASLIEFKATLPQLGSGKPLASSQHLQQYLQIVRSQLLPRAALPYNQTGSEIMDLALKDLKELDANQQQKNTKSMQAVPKEYKPPSHALAALKRGRRQGISMESKRTLPIKVKLKTR